MAKDKKILKKKTFFDKLSTFKRPEVILILAISLMAVFGIVFFSKFHLSHTISSLLPKNTTLGYVEYVNTGNDINGFEEDFLLDDFEDFLNISIEDFSVWAGDSFGLGVLAHENGMRNIYFIEAHNQDMAKEFMTQLGAENEGLDNKKYRGYDVYYYPYSRLEVFTFIGNYLVIADIEENLEDIINVSLDKNLSLDESEHYRRVSENLPKNSSLFIYGDLYKYKEETSFISQYAYIFNVFKNMGVALTENDSGIHFHFYTNLLRKTNSELATETTINEDLEIKFERNLQKIVPSDKLETFFAGVNFRLFFERQLEILQEQNPAFDLIVQGVIQAQIKNIFGDEVDFNTDVLPFFDNEYAMFTTKSDDYDAYTFLFNSDNKDEDAKRAEKILNSYEKESVYFVPTIEERILPDGTIARELVADEDRVEKVDFTYKEKNIIGIDIADYPYSMVYTWIEDVLVFSTNVDVLKSVIDTENFNEGSIATYQPYVQSSKNVFLEGDEIGYMNLRSIINSFNLREWYIDSAKINSVFWSTKTFSDGVSIEGQLLIGE